MYIIKRCLDAFVCISVCNYVSDHDLVPISSMFMNRSQATSGTDLPYCRHMQVVVTITLYEYMDTNTIKNVIAYTKQSKNLIIIDLFYTWCV